MRNSIHFILGDEPVSITDARPETTVLEWLRSQGRVGTKEGCAEGDCGACTVVVAEAGGQGNLNYRAVNSCIQPLVTLDGRQLITVEDLATTDSDGNLALHAVQEAMVLHHGSQCGFCTPGFVMSMFAMSHDPAFEGFTGSDTSAIKDALAGNLCRCTGYIPIVRASRQVLMMPEPDQFEAARKDTLDKIAKLETNEVIRLADDDRQLLVPKSLAELLDMLGQNPDAVMVAGATDVGLWLTKELKQFGTMIYIGEVEELLGINVGDEFIEIGAAVTYSNALATLIEHYPDFEDMLTRLGGLQVRNAGTIGGNIANGSPIGDMPPPLIAINSKIVITSTDNKRIINLEDFFIEYGQQDLRPGECVSRVLLPLPVENQQFRVYKLSKRSDQDITAVLAAFSLKLDQGVVSEIRMAFGGMAGIPARAHHCENALVGNPWNQEAIESACRAMENDYTPLNDWRASADYRMLAAQNLLRRFFAETSESSND